LAWPTTVEELERIQLELARALPEPWLPERIEALAIGGAFVCFERDRSGVGAAGDQAWAGAAVTCQKTVVAAAVFSDRARDRFRSGWLALREGPILEEAVRRLPVAPDVILVDATGRDHPRRAGLAIELGQVLGIPTIGVTRRALVARAGSPPPPALAKAPLLLGEETVGYVLRPATDRQPIVVHAGWRTSPELAARVVESCLFGCRTPEPLRRARELARRARALEPAPNRTLSTE
jgi:deoxyribonuclease V